MTKSIGHYNLILAVEISQIWQGANGDEFRLQVQTGTAEARLTDTVAAEIFAKETALYARAGHGRWAKYGYGQRAAAIRWRVDHLHRGDPLWTVRKAHCSGRSDGRADTAPGRNLWVIGH